MRVIITGGTGLIGSALAESLGAGGHEVILLSRSPEKHKGPLPAGVSLARWDGRTSEGWIELVEGAGAIVNLAGENLAKGRWTKARKRRLIESRTNAGQAVVEAVQKASRKPGVLIQSSAVGFYGPHGDEKVTEKMPAGKDFQARICQAWEASTLAVEAEGVRRAIIRTGIVLSNKGGALPLMALPFRFFVGGPVGSGKQYVPWIHIADEVAAIQALLFNEKASGPYNLSAPNPLTNRGFGMVLANVLRRPAKIPAPTFFLRLVLGEMADVLLLGQRQVPQRLQEMGYKFRFPQADAALRDIYPPKK